MSRAADAPPLPYGVSAPSAPGAGEAPAARPEERLMPVSLEPCPVIEAYKQHVDRTLIRENLKLTPDQRIRNMIEALRLSEELRGSRVVGR